MRQSLELTFCSQCFSFTVECPGSHERDRSMGSGVTPSLSSIVQGNASLDIDGVASIERPVSAADHVDVVCLRMRYVIHTLLLALLPFTRLPFPGLRVLMRIREDALLIFRLLFSPIQPHRCPTSDLALFLLLALAVGPHFAEVAELAVQRVAQRLNGLNPQRIRFPVDQRRDGLQ